jgi:hypothetical protein
LLSPAHLFGRGVGPHNLQQRHDVGRAEEVRAKDAVCNNQHNPGSIVLPKDASCGYRLLPAHSDALQLLPLYGS